MTDPSKTKMYPELSGLYFLGKTIGSGGFAKVKLATHIASGEKVAIKIMDKKLLKDDLPRVYQEIKALQVLSHPNICKLYQVIESDSHFFLIMEYCCGGELFDHIVQKEKLEESEAKIFFRQIVAAVAYCHRLGFAHRDLKPENILLDNNQNLKIVDFGLCIRPARGAHLVTLCGSPNYAAPELLLGEKYYGPQIDIWSLGVLLYALLCGNLPFDDETLKPLYSKILKGTYDEPDWLSLESKNLISNLLKTDPKLRLTTQQLCDHPWLNKGFETTVDDLSLEEESFRRDADCLRILGHYLSQSSDCLWGELVKNKYDHTTACYKILLERKSNKKPLRKLRRPLIESVSSENGIKSPEAVAGGTFVINKTDDFRTPRRSGALNGRAAKRIRSPGLEDREPVAKKPVMSVDRTPARTYIQANERTPSSARRMLNGIERGIRQVLTPRRSSLRRDPIILDCKNMVNVTSTNSRNPSAVLQVLQAALEEKGILCTLNGFTISGKLKRPGNNKLSFELEVCWIPELTASRFRSKNLDGAVVGIRRKRLKGDAWIYKCVCEKVLAVAASQ